MSKNILVESDYAPLREVIIGLAPSEHIFPIRVPYTDPKRAEFYSQNTRSFLIENVGQPIVGLSEGNYILSEIEKEISNFRKALTEEGIIVRKPEPHDLIVDRYLEYIDFGYHDFERKYFCIGGAQVWPRDSMIVLGNAIIEAAPRTPYNRKDIWGLRPLIRTAQMEQGARWLSIPPSFPDYNTGPFLSGGDIVFDGKTVFIGCSGNDTDIAGAEALMALLEKKFAYKLIRLSPKVLHLDCCLSLIRPGLLVWCPEAFIDPLPEEFWFWSKISVSLKEAEAMWVNGLPINEFCCFWPSHATRVINELREFKLKVKEIPFEVTSKFGGSLRCATNPLNRSEAF